MNFYKLPESLEQDLTQYLELVDLYRESKLEKVKLKAFRVPMGVYEQRETDTYMCRVRLPGGAITPLQLTGVAEIAEKYSDRPLHFTTRQEVQIHHVKLEDTVLILEELKKIGLSGRGGGGNTVRNIAGEAEAGADEEEVFDISPYVQALTSRLMEEKDSWNLPRKFKIAFSGSGRDLGLATMNDLGFIAKLNAKGEKGFKVYIAGGMGGKPQPGILLYEFVPHTEVYNLARAGKTFFDKYGNRKNRHAARLRFVFYKFGKEEFVHKFEEELKQVRAQNHPPLILPEAGQIKKGKLELPLLLGDLSAQKAIRLGELLKEYGEDILRATNCQNLLLRNIEEDKIPFLQEILAKEKILNAYPPLIGKAAACAGASACRLGICLSRGLLMAIKEQFEAAGLKADKIEDLSLKISGCPNSCGQHLLADIGFYGAAKRYHNHLVPYYALSLGGRVEEGKTSLAKTVGFIPAKAIPGFLVEYLRFIQETRQEKEAFSDYLIRVGHKKAEELLAKYAPVPDFEADKNYYYDWSAEEVFSLADKVEGECSAGLYDLIDWDFDNLAKVLKQLETEPTSQALLTSAVVFAARALLITKGLEAKTEKEAVELFKQHFIGKHIGVEHQPVLDKYLKAETLLYPEVKGLAETVKKLYAAMDSSLKFPEVEKEVIPSSLVTQGKKEFRDFRGVPCPMNFVKTKLVLEEMQTGEQLEIWLDDGSPIENVPASVKAEGHKILEQRKIDNYWLVVIEKG